MYVDTQDEQFTDLHIDFAPGEIYFARCGDLSWYLLCGLDCVVNKVFV